MNKVGSVIVYVFSECFRHALTVNQLALLCWYAVSPDHMRRVFSRREPLAELRELTGLCDVDRATQGSHGRKATHSPSLCHIRCACVPAKATRFSQPLDVSVMKAFKRAMARHTSQYFAMTILERILRRRSNSSGLQHDDAQSRAAFCGSLRPFYSARRADCSVRVCLEPPAVGTRLPQFLEVVAAATAHHSEGTLFRTSGKQQVTPEQPPDEGEDISGEHEDADELEALQPNDEPDPQLVEADAPLAEPAPAEPAASTSGWSALSGMERLMTLRLLCSRRSQS